MGCYGLRIEWEIPDGDGDHRTITVDVSPNSGGFQIDYIDDQDLPDAHPLMQRLYACSRFAEEVRDARAEDRRMNG